MSMRDYLSPLGATISDNGRSNKKISQMQIASRAFRCAFNVNVKKNVKSNLIPKNDDVNKGELTEKLLRNGRCTLRSSIKTKIQTLRNLSIEVKYLFMNL